MTRVCLCYDGKSESVARELTERLAGRDDISLELYDESYCSDRKRSMKIKGHFAARRVPFCGIFRNDRAVRGFYTEAGECTVQNIMDCLGDGDKMT